MRAITVRQPHASAILTGEKNVENRGFFTKTGDILICAGKSGEGDGPRGVALCVVSIVGFVYTLTSGETVVESEILPEDAEVEMNGYNPGAIGWLLDNIRPVEQIPVRGMPGIFNVDDKNIVIIDQGHAQP